MTAQEWVEKAAARADAAAWRLKGLKLTERGAEEKLHEAADELRAALNHSEDAQHELDRLNNKRLAKAVDAGIHPDPWAGFVEIDRD